MNRFLSALVPVVLLVSCTKAGDLPPAQVLEKAAEAGQLLDSAAFTVTADFSGQTDIAEGTWKGNAHASGVLSDGGKQLQFAFSTDATGTDASHKESTVSLSSDVVVADQNEVYLRLNTFSINPPSQLLSPQLLSQLLSQWWVIASESGSLNSAGDMAPDPSLLRMQASVINVTKDNGLVQLGNHTAYLYDVEIDPAKMKDYFTEVTHMQGKDAEKEMQALADLQATGRIWIDADSFQTHRITWTIHSKNPNTPKDLSLDISFSAQNEPVTITIPANAAPFPGANITDIPAFESMSRSVPPSLR